VQRNPVVIFPNLPVQGETDVLPSPMVSAVRAEPH